jgi:multidrug transporter EmrE-like cation transporter
MEIDDGASSSSSPPARSSREITLLSLLLVVLSCAYSAVVLAFSSINIKSKSVGWAAVCGASVIFSATTMPMKDPALAALQLDPMVFALFTGAGIFLVCGIPLSCYSLGSSDGLIFQPFAILAAADIFVINFFAFHAVEALGVAVAPGVWSGCGMLISFLLGAFLFEERIANPTFAGVAMALLIAGIFGVSTSKTTERSPRDSSPVPRQEEQGEAIELDLQVTEGPEEEEEEAKKNKLDVDKTPTWLTCRNPAFTGALCCLSVGVCDGSLMAPVKASGASTSALNYLASFGLAAGFTSPLLFLLYLAVSRRPLPPLEHFTRSAIPGICSGCIWAAANLLGVIGTDSLGMSIAFPLTQTCSLFSACWGVFFFRESISDKRRFVISMVAIILGSFFLAQSTNS